MALKLKKRGIRNIRPLAGGLGEWQRLSLPVEHARAAYNQSAG
jgi:hypothetical protein